MTVLAHGGAQIGRYGDTAADPTPVFLLIFFSVALAVIAWAALTALNDHNKNTKNPTQNDDPEEPTCP